MKIILPVMCARKSKSAGVQIFQLYANLHTDDAHQPWEKVVKAQTDTAPWDDLWGEVHKRKAGIALISFLDCKTLHRQMVFHHNVAEAIKFNTTNMLKKPNRAPIQQFFVHIEQLNGHLKVLPNLFNCLKTNSATKLVLLIKDVDLATHVLQMRPVKW